MTIKLKMKTATASIAGTESDNLTRIFRILRLFYKYSEMTRKDTKRSRHPAGVGPTTPYIPRCCLLFKLKGKRERGIY